MGDAIFMKIYCFYTPSYEILVNEWFLSTIKDDYKIILKVGKDPGHHIRYKETGWFNLHQEKVKFILEAIRDNWGEVFIYSDPDVQFITKIQNYVVKSMEDKDLVFQKDDPLGTLCAGFFLCRGNEKTLKLWQHVHDLVGVEQKDDQDNINDILIYGIANIGKIVRFFRKNQLLHQLAAKFSQGGMNSVKIKWNYLPSEFLSGGTFTGKMWVPGTKMLIPDKIALHHANWTVGLENKIAQLRYVRDIVSGRQIKDQT